MLQEILEKHQIFQNGQQGFITQKEQNVLTQKDEIQRHSSKLSMYTNMIDHNEVFAFVGNTIKINYQNYHEKIKQPKSIKIVARVQWLVSKIQEHIKTLDDQEIIQRNLLNEQVPLIKKYISKNQKDHEFSWSYLYLDYILKKIIQKLIVKTELMINKVSQSLYQQQPKLCKILKGFCNLYKTHPNYNVNKQMKETIGQSSYIADEIIPIIDQIFKVTEQGLAYCYCCKEFINLLDSVETEFIRHFKNDTSSKHNEFTQLYFKHQKSENKTNQLINNETLDSRDVTEEVKQNMFLQIKDRLAFCKLCNKTINVPASIGEEFMLHFNDNSHEQFLTNLMKGEKSLNRKALYKHFKKNGSAKKQMVLHKPKINGQITGDFIRLLDPDVMEKWKRKQVKRDEVELNQFLELIKKYFNLFVSELIQIECYLEAFCFIMAITGKKDVEICELRFESLAEEIKILSPNEVLSQQLLKMLQNSFMILWEQIGFTRQGYLLEQPLQVQKLGEMLEKVKDSLIIKTIDEDYKSFLMKVQIGKLNNLSKSLWQSYLSDDNQQKQQTKN